RSRVMAASEPTAGGSSRSGLIPIAIDGPDGDRLALLAPGLQPLTYRDLARHIDAVGAALASLAVGPHDCVVTMFPDGLDAATAFLGVANMAACAPLNPRYTKTELEFYLS